MSSTHASTVARAPDGRLPQTRDKQSFDHKYISEDVPVGLMPMRAFGAAAGVQTPAIDALVSLARIIAGRDFADTARTLDRMGLAGMAVPQIRRTLSEGFD